MAEFYEKDLVVEHFHKDGTVTREVLKNLLHFRMSKPGPFGGVGFEFDGPATPAHIKSYSAAHSAYLKSKQEEHISVSEVAPKEIEHKSKKKEA